MGLRNFHLFFITVSVVLAAFLVAWAGGQYRLEHEGIYLLWSFGGLAMGAGLAVYGAAFRRKTRSL